MEKAWIVGVEGIHPRVLGWDRGRLFAKVVWQSQTNHDRGALPYRAARSGADELDLYREFRRDCKDVGYVLGDPPNDS
jgi:hypothetical protein